MLIWVAFSTALALPPDSTVRLWQIGAGDGGQVERMDVSVDGDLVAGRTREDLTGWVLDIERWELRTFDDCDVTGTAVIGVVAEFVGDPEFEIWASCGDGRLIGKTWNGSVLGTVTNDDGSAFEFQVDDTLSGVWWDEASAALYAVSTAGDGVLPRVHVVDPFAALVDAEVFATYPVELPWLDFNEGVISQGSLIVSHGGRNMSSLLLGLSGAVGVPGTFVTLFDCDDLAANPFGGVYCVDDVGQAASYDPATNIFQLLPLGVLESPKAIVANPDLTDGWVAVTGDQVRVWQMTETGEILTSTPYFEGPPDSSNPIQDMATLDGYLYGGGIGGNLHVVTARPWVYPSAVFVDPDSASDGDTISVGFVVDEAVDWELQLGGDRTGNGNVIKSGSSGTDEELEVDVEVDLSWEEGTNDLYIIGTNSQGLTGHAVVTVDVDNPPKPPDLTDANLEFGDQALVLSFDGISDADLDRYEVYVSQTPWTGDDWPTGGPLWDGPTELVTPVLAPSTGSASVTLRIEPLENYVMHYVGLRAIDAGGLEGPMSTVIQGTPEPSFSAAELAGETGGSPCSTAGGGLVGFATVFLSALATRRRRTLFGASRVSGTLGLVVLGALAVAPNQAAAQDDDPWWKQDLTPSRGNLEIRYGVIDLDDENINAVYGANPANLLQIEVGPQFWRVFEVDVGFGFFQELAFKVAESGDPSAERTMLTWFPLAVDGTLRLHLIDEQPLVPFVRYGWDYVLYSDKTDDGAGGKETVSGAKFGTHTSLGLNLLLDVFQPGRASFLEAQTGINDTWLTFEYRNQNVDGRSRPWSGQEADGFDFGGNVFQLGLKVDY